MVDSIENLAEGYENWELEVDAIGEDDYGENEGGSEEDADEGADENEEEGEQGEGGDEEEEGAW